MSNVSKVSIWGICGVVSLITGEFPLEKIINSTIFRDLTVDTKAISMVWAIDGEPGIDYPAYSAVPPRLAFTCKDKIPGYYADTETQCQVWHWCIPGGRQFSFLCPNATVFNQQYRVCDWWYNVECATSENLYKINEDLYKDKDGNLI